MNEYEKKIGTHVDGENLRLSYPVYECEGFVCLCDALGVRSFSSEESRQTLTRLATLFDMAEFYGNQIATNSVAAKIMNEETNISISPPNVSAFGDTILFTWRLDKEDSWTRTFKIFSLWMSHLLNNAINIQLPIRGSFTFGKYIILKDKNITIGPAISDAAGWYESAKWIGIHSTPQMKIEIESKMDGDDEWLQYITSYDIPLKNKSEKLWCSNWPQALSDSGFDGATKHLLSQLAQLHFPPKDSDKYMNTLAFIKHIDARS